MTKTIANFILFALILDAFICSLVLCGVAIGAIDTGSQDALSEWVRLHYKIILI